MIAFESLASLGLSILLLVAGILVLRQRSRGRWLHFLYAWLKIPIAIVGGLGIWWFGISLAGATGGSSLNWFVVVTFVMIAISIAYPIALLIMLRLRSVRDYYAAGNA